MSHPSPEPSLTSLSWVPCGHGTTPEDPVGCRGVDVPGHTACLAHLADAERDAYLHSLTPGTNIDHSGTTFTEPLLDALLDALRDPATGYPRVGDARFISATFEGNAEFDFATFQGEARFRSAIFKGDAVFGAAIFQNDVGFRSAIFKGDAVFEAATFERTAEFRVATFQSDARFAGATFQGGTWFTDTTFQGNAEFVRTAFKGGAQFEAATFRGDAEFEAATFQGDARFVGAVFERAASLGPLVCAGRVMLSGAVFHGPVTLSLASRRLECRRTRWSSTAEIRLRYATVDFAHAVFEYPLTIAAEAEPFVLSYGQPMAEQALADAPDDGVRVASLRGVDAAHLVLADVDLSGCLFAGTVHLDQIRLEGTYSFDRVPPRTHWRHWYPLRFTPAVPSPKSTTGARPVRQLPGAGTWLCSVPDILGRRSWRRCTGRCASRSRTARTSRGRRFSTTARWRCAAMTAPAPPEPNADCCAATGCCPATVCVLPAPWAGSLPPCSSPLGC